MTVKPISLNFDSYVQGGIINDVDVEVVGAVWTLNGPENYHADKPPVFCKLTLKNLDDNSEATEQWWSAGPSSDFVPTDDELRLVPTGAAEFLRKGSNFHMLHGSLVNNCGMPKDFLDSDKGIGVLLGCRFHVVQAPAAKSEGLKGAKEGRTVLIASKAIKTPWDKKKPAAAKPPAQAQNQTAAAPQTQAAAAAQSAEQSAAVDGDLTTQAVALVHQQLAASPVVPLANLKAEIFRKTTADGMAATTRAKLVASLSEAFLTANGFLVVDGNVMSA